MKLLLLSGRKEFLAERSLKRESRLKSANHDFLWVEIFYNSFTQFNIYWTPTGSRCWDLAG